MVYYFQTTYKRIIVDAIIFGTHGPLDSKKDRTMLKLRSERYFRLMNKLVVSENFRASWDIYVHHVSRNYTFITAHVNFRIVSGTFLLTPPLCPVSNRTFPPLRPMIFLTNYRRSGYRHPRYSQLSTH